MDTKQKPKNEKPKVKKETNEVIRDLKKISLELEIINSIRNFFIEYKATCKKNSMEYIRLLADYAFNTKDYYNTKKDKATKEQNDKRNP